VRKPFVINNLILKIFFTISKIRSSNLVYIKH
jgi:hypothetical protein